MTTKSFDNACAKAELAPHANPSTSMVYAVVAIAKAIVLAAKILKGAKVD